MKKKDISSFEQTSDVWNKMWNNTSIKDVATPYGRIRRFLRFSLIKSVLQKFSKENSIIDLGCGHCDTMKIFKDLGFKKLYGIEISPSALQYGRKYGFILNKDVFIEDARNMHFPDKYFDIVFEEGMWEHFHNYEPFVKEACRLASKYLVAVQPDHFSPVGAGAKILWEILWKKGGGVREYTYPLSNFTKIIEKEGFQLLKIYASPMRDDKLLLYKRK